MKHFNYDLIKDEVSTQYTDMKGIVSIDGHLPTDLWKLCKEHGVDTNKWFVIGFEVSDNEPIGDRPLYVSAYVVAMETDNETYDQMAQRLKGLERVEIHKKSFSISYQELGKYVKRLNFAVLSDISSNIQNADFIED
nr:MAG TPA: hypothetical protein [Caudoviricetes sp.]